MTKTNDELMYELLQAKKKNEKIFYGPKYDATRTRPSAEEPTKEVEDNHRWNLNDNIYRIQHRREFIIKIADRDKNNPVVEYTDNHWTRSDFGRVELGEYILMREVYQEEM